MACSHFDDADKDGGKCSTANLQELRYLSTCMDSSGVDKGKDCILSQPDASKQKSTKFSTLRDIADFKQGIENDDHGNSGALGREDTVLSFSPISSLSENEIILDSEEGDISPMAGPRPRAFFSRRVSRYSKADRDSYA